MHISLFTHIRSFGSAVMSFLLITSFVFGAAPGLGSVLTAEAQDVPLPTITNNVVTTTFTISSAATTSAGVFQKDGTLVRTLWGNRHFPAGTHTVSWNGANDVGNLLPEDSYDIKVLTNNTRYTWEGTVGNSSTHQTGPTKWRGLDFIDSMAFAGNRGYAAKGYSEGIPTRQRFDVSDPNQVTAYIAGIGDEAIFVATDGNYVYWAGGNSFAAEGNNKMSAWWVSATRVSDDSKVTFPNGTNYTSHRNAVWNTIDLQKTFAGRISGLAVQKSGPLLIVSHQGLNQIRMFNKTTGALVHTASIPMPETVAADARNNIWVVLTRNGKRVVEKYAVASNGALTLVHAIPNLVEPLAVAVSPDGSYIIVADGGSSQQIKAFSATNAASLWTYGKQGGYQVHGPNVSYDKYFFGRPYVVGVDKTVPGTFIAFQDDGSFWVLDTANRRTVRFSKDRAVLNEIHHAGTTWFASLSADVNDPTRVFNGTRMLEYQIDYSKPLAPNNGSWKLVRNWFTSYVSGGGGASRGWIQPPVTLSNGRTYAVHSAGSVTEYPKNGAPARAAGVADTANGRDHISLTKDGSLVAFSEDKSTNPHSQIWVRRPLTGFTSAGDPQWGPPVILGRVSIPDLQMNGVYSLGHRIRLSSVPAVSSGGILPALENKRNEGFHFGGYNSKINKWAFKTAPTTATNYVGPFPTDEYFNLDSSVKWGTASAVHTLDNTFLWNYYGEGWKNGQGLRFYHVHESGLLIGAFGTPCGADFQKFTQRDCPAHMRPVPGFGGNAQMLQAVKVGNTYYVYHSDESAHAGLHRWRIDNPDSFQIHVKPVTLSYGLTQGLRGTYMKGVDLNSFNTVLVRGDPTIAMNWAGGAPSGTSLPADQFSIRWEGFVRAKASGVHTIFATADDSVRVWIGGEKFGSFDKPIINAWTSGRNAGQKGVTTLTAGKLYPIRIEYTKRSGNASVKLSWSGPGVGKEMIPAGNLFTKTGSSNQNTGTRLLTEYLPFSSDLSGDLYGWKMNPAPRTGWSVKTNYTVHRRDSIPDIIVANDKQIMTGTVTRDLPPAGAGPLSAWVFDAEVTMSTYANRGTGLGQANPGAGTYGVYLDIVDNTGKIIARFSPDEVKHQSEYRITGNKQTLVKYLGNLGGFAGTYLEWPKPLTISAKDGKVTFKFADAPAVTTGLFDSASNWKQPQTLRIYAWNASGAILNHARHLSLSRPSFTLNSTTAPTGGTTGAGGSTGGNTGDTGGGSTTALSR